MFDLGNAYKNQLIDAYAENKYYSDVVKIDMKDKNNTKVIITDRVDKESTCLDVGCGAGFLGEVLHKHKDAKVYGVDIDERALEHARELRCFEELYNFSVSDESGKDYKKFKENKIKFDYIIFADILEHVVDAGKVIMFFVDYLNENGKIIISLPNIAHFDIVRGLMNGKFNYNHIGLLDNTHLRFYTKSSFREYVQQINEVFGRDFALKEVGKTIARPEYLEKYPQMLKILDKNKEACVLQYVYELSMDGGKTGKCREVYTFDELEVALEKGAAAKCELKKLQERVTELERGVDSIYNSMSWRITKPVRAVRRIMNNFGGVK